MILHYSFARRFALIFFAIFAIFLLILGFLDLVDQLRRFGGSEASLLEIASLTGLGLPTALYTILPLIVILSSIVLFLSLARSSEMVVTRAAGRSALKALLAPLAVVLLIGLLAVGVGNPIVAGTSKLAEQRLGELRGNTSVLALGETGLWLRQGDADGQIVIGAETTNLDGTELSEVTFIVMRPGEGPVTRIEAARARLTPGAWEVEDAKVWDLVGSEIPEAEALESATMTVPSTLTADQIRDSFGTPSSIPFWELPGFIDRLQRAGFSARRHMVWFQSELAQPVFLMSMVLIGAAFTLRHQRGQRTGLMVLMSILLAFILYFIRNFAMVLGENGQLPPVLAAWAAPLAAVGLSMGFLLHHEDG